MADNKDKKVLNVPALRFPEFNGEWITRPIKDIADFIGGGTPSSANEAYWQGTIPWVSSSDIVEDNINDITISRYITEEAISNSATKLCSAPVILIVSRVGVGKVALSSKAICTSQDFCNLINIKVHPTFLAYSLSPIMKRKSIEVQGTSIKGITSLEIQKIILHIPSLQEQHKISDLFQLIDKRIAVQSKIIEKLETLIKGIVDTIFTANKFPKVPFKEIYVRAGEGGTPATSNSEYYDNGTIPFIKIDDLQNKYIKTNKDCITELGLQKSSAWIVPANSIIYSNGATIGAISINLFPVCTKQGILGVVPKADINVEFLYYFMTSTAFTKAVERIVTEGTMRTAYLKDINHILCPVPCSVKQDEIAKLLSTLSEKLENEVIFQMKLQKQKEFLLSQMFI